MKKLFALLAGALCFGVAIAAEQVITVEEIEKGGFNPFLKVHQLGYLPAKETLRQLEEVKDAILESNNDTYKIAYAVAQTIAQGKQNPELTYAELTAKLEENCAAIQVSEGAKTSEVYVSAKIKIVQGWFSGEREVSRKRTQEAYDALKDSEDPRLAGPNLGELAKILNRPFEEAQKYYSRTIMGKQLLVTLALSAQYQQKEFAAQLYWELLQTGNFGFAPIAVDQLFPVILAYELSKTDADIPALKAKLQRAILVYKGKARLWKPSKEGEANPYIEFVGMLQDTAKDL